MIWYENGMYYKAIAAITVQPLIAAPKKSVKMEDVYETPSSSLLTAGDIDLPTRKKVLATILALASAGFYFLAYKITPIFAETFYAFDTTLPLVTMITLKLQPYLGWFVGVSLTPALLWFLEAKYTRRKNILFKISVWHFCAVIILFVLLLWALYAPAFSIAEAV